MAMVLILLVIVDQIHIVGVALLEPKHDAPVTRHRYGPDPFKLALERVKPEAGKSHVANRRGLIETGKNTFDLVQVCR